MRTAGLDQEQVLDRLDDFHGHLGPYVVLGFRAGQLGLRLLGAVGYFDLEARLGSGTRTPVSCFADGVQLGSGCTTGKGNLTLEGGGLPAGEVEPVAAEPTATVVFRSRPRGDAKTLASAPASGSAVRVTARPEAIARAATWHAELGERAGARRLLDTDERELFIVDRLS